MSLGENMSVIATAVPADLPLHHIGETLGRFRLVDPKAQARLAASIKTYGQLAPAIALASDSPPFELVDGFKRLRALRAIGSSRMLRVIRLEFSSRAAKVAVLEINRAACRVSDFEESLVLQSLSRDDALTQVEIAALFNRDQSWVSRKIAIAELLCDEAKELIQLGLLGTASGREIMRMPRGIQPRLLEVVQKHAMTSREVARLVAILLSTPQPSWDQTLRFPTDVLAPRVKPAKIADTTSPSALAERLLRLASHCQTIKRDLSRNEIFVPAGTEHSDAAEHTIKVMTWTIKSIRRALLPPPISEEAL